MAVTIRPISSTVTTATFVSVGGYTMATGVTGIALSLNVANVSGSNASAIVDVARNDGTTNYYIANDLLIPPGGAVSVISTDNRTALASGYSIRVLSATATNAPVDVVGSVVEFT